MRNLLQYIGLRHLRAKPVRTILTGLGVAFGIALYVAIRIINQSTLASFKESVNAVAGKASLTVSAGKVGFPEDRLDLVRAVPGVRRAVPMIESRAYIARSKDSSETLYVFGVDLLQEQSVRTYSTTDHQVIDDPLVFLNQPDSIIVTHVFAQEHRLDLEGQFDLATTQGPRTLTIRGLLSPEGPAKAFGGAVAIMDIDAARRMFGKEGKLDRIDIVPEENETIDLLAQRLREKLGNGYTVERPSGQAATLERMMKSSQAMLTFFSMIALLVGLFMVGSSINIAVAERRREIGVLRALGASSRQVLFLFLGESVTLGALSSFLGALLGRGLADLMVASVSRSLSNQYQTQFLVRDLQFTGIDVLEAVTLGASASLLAALWPAFQATFIGPAEAIKNRSGPPLRSRSQGLLPGLAVTGSISFVLGAGIFMLRSHYPSIEKLGYAAVLLGTLLLAPPLVLSLIRLARTLIKNSNASLCIMAHDQLLRDPGRTGSNAMSLLIGLILVMMTSTLNLSFKRTLLDWFDRILQADLIVSSHGKMVTYETQPIDEALAKELLEVPGIRVPGKNEGVALRVVKVPYEGIQIAIKAWDQPPSWNHYAMFDVLDRPREEAGAELFNSLEPAVMISDNFSRKFGKKTGDRISLETPTGTLQLKVIALVADFASNEGVLYLNRRVYRHSWKDPLVTLFGFNLTPGADLNQVRKEVDRRFGRSRNLMTVSNLELRSNLTEVLESSFGYTRAIEAAALLVAGLGLLNTFLISVMTRRREFGLLRAVGMSRKQLGRMILYESLIQGVLGAFLAVGFGLLIAYFWITYVLTNFLGWVVTFHLPTWAVFSTLFAGIGVAVVAGILPSRRAARLEICDALESE